MQEKKQLQEAITKIHANTGWQKLCLRQKVWTRTDILSPNIRYFVAILGFVAIYAFLGKKVLFRVKKSVSCTVTWYMLHIIYISNLQICNYALKRHICHENCKYAPDKNFCCHFCPHRKAANSATLCGVCCMLLVFVVTICDNLHAQGKIIFTSIMIKSNLQD